MVITPSAVALFRPRLQRIVAAARARARRKGIPFELTSAAVLEQIERQNYRCAVTGLPLLLTDPVTGAVRNPWSPSLDRQDPHRGYVPGNVDVVCYIYNGAKAAFRHDDVMLLAHALVGAMVEDEE